MGGKLTALRRAAVAVVAGALFGLVAAGPAMAADPVVVQPIGGQAYGSVRLEGNRGSVGIGPMWLGFRGGEKALAYCIDLHHPVAIGSDYAEGTWSESAVRNLAKVQWVLLHGHPKVSANVLLTAAGASSDGIRQDRVDAVLFSATQVAVWHFSDGATLTGNGSFQSAEYQTIQKVYAYLTGHATDQPEPAATLSISPGTAGTVTQGGKAGPFTVTGPSGDIQLTIAGGTAVDASGHPVTTAVNGGRFYLTRATPGEVSVSAKAQATHSTGRVFLFRGNQARQKLILAGTAGDELTAGAKAAFTAKAESNNTPAPANTGAAAQGAGGGGGELALTGTSLIGPIIGGLALLAAGVAAVILVRRRRVRFTA